jgi:hypothetical protein
VDLAVGNDGVIYVTGWYKTTCDFDPGPGVEEYTTKGYTDAYLVKIMPSGYWWE